MNKLHFSKEKIDMEYKVVKIEGLTIFCGKNNIGKILFTKYVLSEIKPPDELRIFEYPENSLHPELQIEKAKTIIDMVKNNENVLVLTHSTYILSALLHFVKKDNLVDKYNLYWFEKDDDAGIRITEKTKNESYVFDTFAEPMRKILFDS